VSPNTLFQAASIGKPVAAFTALQLVERGVLDLDQDVNEVLTSWRVPGNELTREEPVTLRGILSHTAGLTVHGFGGYSRGQTLPSVLEILEGSGPANNAAVRVDLLPGRRFRYSGGGYVVLQKLCEDATQRPFAELVEELVFDPLGMDDSLYAPDLRGDLAVRAAVAHDGTGRPLRGRWQLYPEFGAGAGLWTTPGDLARFVVGIQQARAGNGVLDPALVAEMLTPQPVEEGLQGVGLGLQVGQAGGARWFAHSGQNAGYLGRMVGFADEGRGAVVLTNGDGGAEVCDELIQGIAVVYDWPAFGPAEVEVVAVDEAVLEELQGDYRSEEFPGFHIQVTLQQGQPVLTIEEPGIELHLLAVSDWEYATREAPAEVTFELDEQGHVTGFRFTGDTLPAFSASKLR
jgi:CubicO group peptidase (beta-lactamase class C family)